MASIPSHVVSDNRIEQVAFFNAVNSMNCRNNILLCSICNQWLRAPIFSENAVHMCGQCYVHGGKRKNAASHNKELEVFLSAHYFPCVHFKRGCGVVSTYPDLRHHEENCNVLTEAWKDLRCCVCEYKTPDRYDLVHHYKDTHFVATIKASNMYAMQTGLILLEMQNALYLVKCRNFFKQNSIQICAALGTTAHLKLQLKCICSKIPHVVTVASNLNQLNSESAQSAICYCPKKIEPYSEAKIDFAFQCVDCCEQSFTAQDHCKHILSEHSPHNGPLVKRGALDETKPEYIFVDGNIFRLRKNTLSKLYCFAGNWAYSVRVLYKGIVQENYELEFDETWTLPKQWDLLYIFRIEEYDEVLVRKFTTKT